MKLLQKINTYLAAAVCLWRSFIVFSSILFFAFTAVYYAAANIRQATPIPVMDDSIHYDSSHNATAVLRDRSSSIAQNARRRGRSFQRTSQLLSLRVLLQPSSFTAKIFLAVHRGTRQQYKEYFFPQLLYLQSSLPIRAGPSFCG